MYTINSYYFLMYCHLNTVVKIRLGVVRFYLMNTRIPTLIELLLFTTEIPIQ